MCVCVCVDLGRRGNGALNEKDGISGMADGNLELRHPKVPTFVFG